MPLKEFANQQGFRYIEEEGTYNLSYTLRNLPIKKATLEKEEAHYKITIHCTFLSGTSTSPAVLSGNTSDQFRYQLHFSFTNTKTPIEFKISERGFLSTLFGKSNFKISSKNKRINTFLLENPRIHALYTESRQASELSPFIDCKTTGKTTTLSIHFQAFNSHDSLILDSIHFCHELMNYVTASIEPSHTRQ